MASPSGAGRLRSRQGNGLVSRFASSLTTLGRKTVGHQIHSAYHVPGVYIHARSGEIEVWIDGVSVILISGMTLREVDGGRIRGMHFQTFFGGKYSHLRSLRIT